jgi:alpha-tubulin suppressor-like RCC1 family protein
MQNREILLSTLLAIALIFSLMLPDFAIAQEQVMPMVATGWRHTVGLKSNGAVVAVGLSISGQCDVDDWRDITQIAAGSGHTVALKADGTVVTTNSDSASELAKWNLLIAVPPMNCPLIGGIIAAVTAGGLVIFLVRRRRPAKPHVASRKGGNRLPPFIHMIP